MSVSSYYFYTMVYQYLQNKLLILGYYQISIIGENKQPSSIPHLCLLFYKVFNCQLCMSKKIVFLVSEQIRNSLNACGMVGIHRVPVHMVQQYSMVSYQGFARKLVNHVNCKNSKIRFLMYSAVASHIATPIC